MDDISIGKILDRYRNTKDPDIEDFLRNKAITYEKRKWCSVYVLVNEEKLNNDDIFIEGYFTLSNRVLQLSDKVSNNTRKKLFNGLSKTESHIHVLLIGQLGKYIDGDDCSLLSAEQILDSAFEIIEQVKERIVCNCVMPECDSERDGLKNTYTDYGFYELQSESSLIQYFTII